MIKDNSTIEQFNWYIHDRAMDMAIYCFDVTESGQIGVEYWNIVTPTRKYLMERQYLHKSVFERSPLWRKQGDWLEEVLTLII
jgi:hypothetical protein